MSLLSELKRRNVLKVGVAYLVAAWLLIQVAATVAPQLQLPEWVPRLITLLLMLGFPIALLVSWFLEHTPEGIKVETATAGNKRIVGISLALAAVALGWYLYAEREGGSEPPSAAAVPAAATKPRSDGGSERRSTASKSIAVLPFVNMSGDAEQEFFADGLSEEILNSLTRIDGMQVAGRTSSFQFKGKNEDLRGIGEKLGVASVLEGSVRRGKDAMRVTAQLIRVSDGIHVWSETYDREPDDTLAVQLDIAERVAGALDVVLDDAQRERMRLSGVKNVEAFIAYQKGRQLYSDAHDPTRSDNLIQTLREAGVHFARATALEPDFAAAYYLGTDLYSHIVMTSEASADERAAAMASARRDLALAARHANDEPTRLLVEADAQLISNDWRGLADRLKAAVSAQGCRQSNWLLVVNAFGLAAERMAVAKDLIACDPLSGLPYLHGATSANWLGQPQAARDFATQAEAAMGGTGTISAQKVRALVALGRVDEAQGVVAGMPPATAERVIAELLIAAASGADVAGVAAQSRDGRHLGWNPGYWDITDLLAEALTGDRAAANRRAAEYDAEPGGALKIAVMLALCQCGVAFDLDAAPNFKARLAESGLAWPPPDLIAALRRERPPTP